MSEKDENKRVPELNIGLLGHVDSGKTTLTKALSGKWTDTHSEELKRGITIRLGYADYTVYRCPEGHYTREETCPEHEQQCEVSRTISLVDAPGHETLMANVLSGAALIDGAMLLISADEACPQPQTREHLVALDIVGCEKIVIVQNKIDRVDEDRALESYEEIKDFVEGTIAEDAPIVPVSAQHGSNLKELIKTVEDEITTPERKDDASPLMLVARSFDINKPGRKPKEMHGGIVGGSLIRGQLEEGEEVILKPGAEFEDNWSEMKSKAVNVRHGQRKVEKGQPGGLLSIETGLDPYFTKSDGLAGNVLGHRGEMPGTISNIKLEVHLLDKVVGAEDEKEIENIKAKEPLLLNMGTAKTSGIVKEAGKTIEVDLKSPICPVGDRVSISRRIGSRWRLIGYGIPQ